MRVSSRLTVRFAHRQLRKATKLGTHYSKGKARTQLEMADLNWSPRRLKDKGDSEKTARLTISTSKDLHGLLSTSVSVTWVADRFETFMIFGDFMIRPLREKVRCTEKAVREQHERALAQIEEYKERAREFYAAKARAE